MSDYHPNFSFEDADFRAFLQQALRDMELHLNSIHIHPWQNQPPCDLATLDPQQRNKTLADHRRAVDMAADLGGCILLDFVHFGRPTLTNAPHERNLLINNEIELGDLYVST